jgi:2-polyprenyl-6-methoxyphenol hydroxylase-like FAD-dependent oxidoreductase
MLGRAGHRVTVVERDVVDDGGSGSGSGGPEAAFAVSRQGAPQTHQTHGFLARLRLELRDRLPDVLAAIEAAGGHTLGLTGDLGDPRPGDEDLAVLIVRRTTLEWVLRQAVGAEPNVHLRPGESVVGLVTSEEIAGTDGIDGRGQVGTNDGVPSSQSMVGLGPADGGGGADGAPRPGEPVVDPVDGGTGVGGNAGSGGAGGGLRPGEPVVDLVDGGTGGARSGGRGGSGRPHVAGVRLAGGQVVAGTVVACTGSRGDVPAWLAELGVEVPEEEHQTKLVYLTRWYRLPEGVPLDANGGRLFGDLGYIRYLVVPCDGGTLSATLAVHVRDADLRAQLLDGDRFDRAVRRLPGPDGFFEAGPVEPLGPVRPMAGLVNRLRRFVDDHGQPLVTGFHAVGDAHTCTNPLYGRGCSLAMVQAGLLADAFAAHPDDPRARSAVYEAGSIREVEPWFHGSVQMDKLRARVDSRRTEANGDEDASADGTAEPPAPAPAPEAQSGAETAAGAFARIMNEGGSDPVIGRVMIRLFNLLTLPNDLFTDTEFIARVGPLLAKPAQPRPEPEGPTLAELLA